MRKPSLLMLSISLLFVVIPALVLMGCGAGHETTPTVAPPTTTAASTMAAPPTMPTLPTTAPPLTSAAPTTTAALTRTAAPVVLPQDGTYYYEQATIVVNGYWKQHRARGYEALSGSFPCLRVTVSCTEDCSLVLEPMLRFSDDSTVQREPNGLPVEEEVDLAAGEAKSIAWYFEVVAPGAVATRLEIEIRDRTGQADSGQAVFELEEPSGVDPWSTTSTT